MIKIKPDPARKVTKTTMAALRLAIARKKPPVTKPVTKQIVTVTKSKKVGRPRIHGSDAGRSAAYRKRKLTRRDDVTAFVMRALGMGV